MEEIDCILCFNSESKIVIKENGFVGKKCLKCGLIFVSPRPNFLKLKNHYTHAEVLLSKRSRNLGRRLRARHNLSIIKKFKNSGSLLEIGAGEGVFAEGARNLGFDIYTIELNQKCVEFINHILNIPCENTTLALNSFREKNFDIVFHCDVLSHFSNPCDVFKKIFKKLKKNGFLIFETGNFGDVDPKYYRFISTFGFPEHLFHFGEKSMIKLLNLTGFKIVKIYRYSILWWLIIDRFIKCFFLKNSNNFINQLSNRNSNNSKHFIVKKIISFLISYLLYLVNYKIGTILPKNKRPQTVIYIIKKS